MTYDYYFFCIGTLFFRCVGTFPTQTALIHCNTTYLGLITLL